MIRVGIVLAAGRSERFGPENKLLAPVWGRPLASHAAASVRAASLDHRIAVVADPAVARLFEGFEILHVADPLAGQSASLVHGVQRAGALGADRVLVALADMPRITAEIIDRVVARCTDESASAVTDGSRTMPPACFPGSRIPEIAKTSGDRGARQLLAQLPPQQRVIVAAECLADVDHAADISALDPG